MPRPRKLTFDLLILKVVSESRVTCATSVPISVFLRLSVLDLGPMNATERQTLDRRQTRIIPRWQNSVKNSSIRIVIAISKNGIVCC